MSGWFSFLFIFAWSPAWVLFRGSVMRRLGSPPSTAYHLSLAISAFFLGFVFAAIQDWPPALGEFAGGAAVLLICWWRRRDRKRAARALGAKSRALRDALIRKAREAGTPRPALRPVPAGAR